MTTRPGAVLLALAALAAPAGAQEDLGAERPDAHAPVGVAHGHLLTAGAFMVGYRYDFTRFGHLRRNSERVGPEAAFDVGYALVPEEMTAHRHVAEVWYAPTEQVTLVAELPFVQRTITHERRIGDPLGHSVSGIGDLMVGGLLELLGQADRRAHATVLFGLPTGRAAERDEEGSLVYAMQPGSGTFHVRPALTFQERRPDWSWGAQAGGRLYFGEAGEGFRLSNRLDLGLWAARQLLPWASASVRLAGDFRGDVDHRVPDFPLTPAAEPGLTGGQRIDLLLGANLRGTTGGLVGQRLFFELGLPIHQRLDGPQLGMSWRGLIGWRWMPGQG